jgi:hypothetical protein
MIASCTPLIVLLVSRRAETNPAYAALQSISRTVSAPNDRPRVVRCSLTFNHTASVRSVCWPVAYISKSWRT